jgi:hypothetical protein
MRGVRSFLVLLVALLGLGAYLYFVESKRDPDGDEVKKARVFTVEAEAIQEVTVTSDAGETTTMKKGADGWRIVAPVEAQADGAEISGITSTLSNLEQQRLIDENPADLQAFGLADPRIEVAFKTDGDEQTLLIGSKTPVGSDVYAKNITRQCGPPAVEQPKWHCVALPTVPPSQSTSVSP